ANRGALRAADGYRVGEEGREPLHPPGAPDHGAPRAPAVARMAAAAPERPLRALQRHRTAARSALAAVRDAGAAGLERRDPRSGEDPGARAGAGRARPPGNDP